MKMQISTLSYSDAFVDSLILTNGTLSVNELNELYPAIDIKKFTSYRKRLVNKGLVDNIKSIPKTNKVCVSGYTDDELRTVICNNPTLKPKELNALVPDVSWNRFNGLRYSLFRDVYKSKRIDRRIAEIHKIVSNKKDTYKDKNFKAKEENRDIMANMVYQSGIYGLIGSLSHIDCLVERKLNALTDKNTFLNIDNDKLIVEGAKLTMEKYNLKGTAVCGDMLDVLKKYKENDFAHLYMDFCGTLPIYKETLKYAIDNNLIGVGSYIFLTISNVVRKVVNGYANEFNSYKVSCNSYQITQDSYNNEVKETASYSKNKEMLKNMMSDKFIEVIDKPYQTGTPMLFYVMQRVK
jgi:hypothetical protein